MRIGLISDTHGLLRPEAVAFLDGCDRIVHAGDVGDVAILHRLAEIAPLTAVRGNNDTAAWARALASTETLRLATGNRGQDGIAIHVIHDLAELAIDPRVAGVRVVVSGHSHEPRITERDGLLYVNPGSAGRRRFRLPISIGELLIDGSTITPNLQTLRCP